MELLAELHPKVIHFPIALLFTYILFEVIGAISKKEFFSKAAYAVLILGILGAIFAVITGNQAFQAAEILEEKGAIIPFGTIDEHEKYANILLWYFIILAVARTYFFIKKKFTGKIKLVFAVAAIIGAFFIYETGEEGGKLVFEHGVGTELIEIFE